MTLYDQHGREINPGAKADLWIMIRMEPMDGLQGEFFVSHARNFPKYDKRKGFSVIAHSYDRGALTLACRQATLSAGEAYQPPHSNFRQEIPNLVGDTPDPSLAMPDSALNSDELLDPTEPENDVFFPDLDL